MLPREEMPGPARSPPRRPVLAFTGGTGLAGALAGVALTLLLVRGGAPNDAAVQAVIDSAIRSRMADHLTDVLTSDQHTVKPWLSARLNVSPSVPELEAKGFRWSAAGWTIWTGIPPRRSYIATLSTSSICSPGRRRESRTPDSI